MLVYGSTAPICTMHGTRLLTRRTTVSAIALRCSIVVAGPWPCDPRMKNPWTPESKYQSVNFSIIGKSGSPLPSNTAGIGMTNPFTVFFNSATDAMRPSLFDWLEKFAFIRLTRMLDLSSLSFLFTEQPQAFEHR